MKKKCNLWNMNSTYKLGLMTQQVVLAELYKNIHGAVIFSDFPSLNLIFFFFQIFCHHSLSLRGKGCKL